MESGHKIQLSSKGSINHLQPQPNSNYNLTQQQLKLSQKLQPHFEPYKFVNDGQRQTVQRTFEQHSLSQIQRQSSQNSNKKLSGEQNERLRFLQNFDVSAIFASKKLYNPLTEITQKFTSTIQNGIISVNHILTEQNSKSICFKKNLKEESDNFSVKDKIEQIQQKKQQIFSELKQLYKAQQQLRIQQKLIWIQKKSHHQFTSSPKGQSPKLQSPLRTKLTSKKNLLYTRQKSYSSISQFRAESKAKQNEPNRRLLKSSFTEEQKKAINLILKRENQNKLRHIQRQQKILERLQSQQKLLQQKEKNNLEMVRSRRKQLAIERLKRQNNSRTSFIVRKTKIHTQPEEIENNQFFPTNPNFNNSSNHSHLASSPKKSYSYINYQQLDQKKQRQQAEQFRLVLQKRKSEKKFDFGSIKVHLEKYRQAKNQQDQLEKDKIQHFKLQQKLHIKEIRQKYGFLTQIKQTMLQEERNSIEKYQKQLEQKINYHKKMKDYFYSIHKNPKVKSANIINHKNHKIVSEENMRIKDIQIERIRNNNNAHKMQEFQKKNVFGIDKDKEKIDKNLRTPSKMPDQKVFIPEKIQLSNFSQEALTKRRQELNENIRKKEQQMMKLLKRDTSSLSEIKKALDIFDQLQNTSQSASRQGKRKSKKQTVAW